MKKNLSVLSILRCGHWSNPRGSVTLRSDGRTPATQLTVLGAWSIGRAGGRQLVEVTGRWLGFQRDRTFNFNLLYYNSKKARFVIFDLLHYYFRKEGKTCLSISSTATSGRKTMCLRSASLQLQEDKICVFDLLHCNFRKAKFVASICFTTTSRSQNLCLSISSTTTLGRQNLCLRSASLRLQEAKICVFDLLHYNFKKAKFVSFD
ncbi:hypothetical protein J1N35_045028 [Gossypium stocksii]|uniref:Uncharacterized protein n=1 Tax=Gossypium stocksii TaxID=47602 RepID=A0A9D3ZG62_9ROSI|nr:hypothetical protein J1N35_045028 [Gossypium stocksii]